MKKILVVLSEYGYWGEELVGPKEEFEKAGIEMVIATPTGSRPYAIPVSYDETMIDPPLGRGVVSKEIAEKTKAIEASSLLDNPLNIRKIMPEYPYPSEEGYLRKYEAYYKKLEELEEYFNEYNALLIVGGSGPIVDLVNNWRVHNIILIFHKLDKPIATECYATTCLAFARDKRDKQCIIKGKHVTGHPLEFDYKEGWGTLKHSSSDYSDIAYGFPVYPLEYILRDAVGEEGRFIGNVGNESSVVVDYPFITSRSTASSRICGEKLVDVLENGLKRFGW